MLRRLLAAVTAAALAHTAYSQGCTSGQIFLKNDNLPDIPGTANVSIIQGLCEGESSGCVFDVSNQTIYSSEVKVEMCAVGYINAASANGITAVVNLRIFDGVTWVGSTPIFGPQKFDFEAQTGSSIQISSSAINTVAIPSAFDVRITSGKLVVVWDMEINTGGNCPSGYQTNYATDWNGSGAGCSPLQKNLMFISGTGWKDAAQATVLGFPLCPIYYAGNWLIRACVSPVGYPQSYCTGKLNSANCVATVGWTGTSTLSGADDFHVRCTNVVAAKQGILFWGSSTASLPFFNGLLCVSQPVIRTPVQNSGGTTGCTGSYDFHFSHAYMNQYALQNGDVRHAEFWYRDPANLDGTNIGLSNALSFKIVN